MKIRMAMVLVLLMVMLSACQSGDTTAPVITVDPNFQAVQTLGGMLMMPTATCVDDTDATCYVETQYDPNWSDNLTPGTYTFTFVAEDRAGNVATETVTLTLN